jgi:hypothetical protein
VAEVSTDIAPATAGQAAEPASSPQALLSQLSILQANATTAQNRLVNMVDATQAAETVEALIKRYAALQTKITGLLNRLQAIDPNQSDGYAALIRDQDALAIEVQGYIEAVESLVGQYPKSAAAIASGTTVPAQPMSRTELDARRRKVLPYVVLGGMFLLVAGGGYLIWAQKKKQDKAHTRSTRKALGAITARGGKGR